MRGGGTHHEVGGIAGAWRRGTVRGWVYEITWGPAEGWEGLTLDDTGSRVEVDVIESDVLDRHLDRIDRSQGAGYRRVTTAVLLDDGSTEMAEIYEADPEA